MTDDQETTDMHDPTAALARVRGDLISAVIADQHRSQRRRRTTLTGLAITATLAVASGAVAATTGILSPAPESIKRDFVELDQNAGGVGIDATRAIRIGVIDDRTAYAAPQAGGGFCLYFVKDARSGPTGNICLADEIATDKIAVNLSGGSDGGFVFGRVGNDRAASVDIALSGNGGAVTAKVVQDRFFVAMLPEGADATLSIVSVTARDADGAIVAQSGREPARLGDAPATSPVPTTQP